MQNKLEEIIASIDISGPVPEEGDQRQYYYIKKMRDYTAAKSQELGRKLTACTVTFGCQMNAKDSEKLAGILEACGFDVRDEENSDFLIYNTCTVRDNADQHLYGRIGRASHYKKKKSGNEDRSLWLYDAGEDCSRQTPQELSLCGSHIRNA